MSEGFNKAMVGGFIRVVEAGVSAAPTLLVGLLIAAVFRYYLGREGTRRLFGGDSLRSLPQSWAVGMLLPVCSIGVLPILFEMRRSRIKPGAMSAFALSAPLFNPLSLLYGLTLSRPYVILFFALGSLAVVTLVGLFWDRRVSTESTEQDDERDFRIIGIRRLFAVIVRVTRDLAGTAGGWSLVGLVGIFLLSAVLPWGAMQSEVNRDDWWAPLKMTGVALPAYATPMLAMSQMGMMFQHANSPGAAFALLVLGTGVNVATVVWLGRTFGGRSVGLWIVSVVVIVIGIAYAINRPLFPPGVEPHGHTHAFDIYTNPIHDLDNVSWRFVEDKIRKDIDIGEQFALLLMGAVLLIGILFRIVGIDDAKLEQPAGDQPEDEAAQLGSFDRIVGPQLVGGTLLAGLIALSIVMCYAFYPSTEESLEEIRVARAEALSAATSGNAEHALFWIPIWDEWSRRLEVGTFIRRGELRPYQRMQGYLIRKKLEDLEHELHHEPLEPEAIKAIVTDLLNTNSRWVRSYRDVKARPDPVLLTGGLSADSDVTHEHPHTHGPGIEHDHDHGDFVGTHTHPHDHLHRHSDGPNGGKVVAIGHSSHESGEELYHAEIMPLDEGRIGFQLLAEASNGDWEPFVTQASKILATVGTQTADADGPAEITFEPVTEDETSSFAAQIPASLTDADELHVAIEKIVLGGQNLSFEFTAKRE